MKRQWGYAVTLWLMGCGSVDPIAPPNSSGESFGSGSATATDTDSGTAGAGDTDATGGDTASASSDTMCPAGEEGCGCLPQRACADGLVCASDLCVPPGGCDPQDVGSEGCPCTQEGVCDAELICASDLCVMPAAPG